MSRAFSALQDPDLRRDSRDFSRHGPLTPELLTTILLFMVADANTRGYDLLLQALWSEARDHGLKLPTEHPIAGPSFCEAREKIKPELLRRMVHEVATHAYEDTSTSRRWRGRRVFALDGTKINLQRSEHLHRHFATPHDAHCPQLLLSMLLDVCAKHPVDFEIGPFASDERAHLFAVLPSLAEGDLIILDRGYPSHEIIQVLTQAKVDFLIRVPASHTFRAVDDLIASGQRENACVLSPPDGSPSDWAPLSLRVVRTVAPSGDDAYFLTSLRSDDCAVEELGALYHMRWEVEEFFKLLKGDYIGQGQFRSKSSTGVRQEASALVLFLAITRLCAEAVDDGVEHRRGAPAQKAAVLAMASRLTRILLPEDTQRVLHEIGLLLQAMAATRYRKRPNRSFPRVSKRPTSRWTATGRRGA